jgi:1,4-dihydroxy-2-naphthoate octaprenyltransferase
VNKRTTVVIFGRRIMSLVYLFSGVVAMLIMYPVWSSFHLWALIIPAIYIVMHIMTWNMLRKAKGAELNPLLGKTALNLLLFTTMFLLLSF